MNWGVYTPSNILLNVLLVGGSIVVVVAPFLATYLIKNRKKHQGLSLQERLNDFFSSHEADALVFIWAMGEALVWFVVPEFLLFLIIFMRVKHKFRLLIYDILGTAVGTVVGVYFWLSKDVLLKVPYVYESMFDKVTDWYTHMGIWGLVNQPFSGVPYKVFLVEAHNYNFIFILFLIVALTMRIGRYTFFYAAFTVIYPLIHKFVFKNYLILVTISIIIFTLALMKVSYTYTQ